MIARSLLSAVSFAALTAWDPVLAEDKPVGLPEVKVIANTPLAPASPRPPARPAERAPPRVAETPPPRAAETSSRRAALAPSRTVTPSQPAPEAASAPADPSLIERDKIPANVQTLSAGDFDHAKAPDLPDAMSRGLPGVALGDQTVRNLFNQHYYTFGTFFQTDSFPYLNLTDPRTFVPGAPLTAYAGLRARW
jgi:hypothetical protein